MYRGLHLFFSALQVHGGTTGEDAVIASVKKPSRKKVGGIIPEDEGAKARTLPDISRVYCKCAKSVSFNVRPRFWVYLTLVKSEIKVSKI